jgi:hypothetical protein
MEHACTQEERITRIEISVTTVGEKVDSLATDVKLLTQVVRQVIPTLEEHDRALKGNNGNTGLIAKVANAIEVLNDLQEALRGRGEHPGLIATIDRLVRATEEWNDTKKWLSRLVAGWLITTVMMILLELLKK